MCTHDSTVQAYEYLVTKRHSYMNIKFVLQKNTQIHTNTHSAQIDIPCMCSCHQVRRPFCCSCARKLDTHISVDQHPALLIFSMLGMMAHVHWSNEPVVILLVWRMYVNSVVLGLFRL